MSEGVCYTVREYIYGLEQIYSNFKLISKCMITNLEMHIEVTQCISKVIKLY